MNQAGSCFHLMLARGWKIEKYLEEGARAVLEVIHTTMSCTMWQERLNNLVTKRSAFISGWCQTFSDKVWMKLIFICWLVSDWSARCVRHSSVFAPYLQKKGLGEPRPRAGAEAGPGAGSSGPPPCDRRRGEEEEEEKDVGLRRCCRRLLLPWQRNFTVGQILVSVAPWREEKSEGQKKKNHWSHADWKCVSVQAGVHESLNIYYTALSTCSVYKRILSSTAR